MVFWAMVTSAKVEGVWAVFEGTRLAEGGLMVTRVSGIS